MQSVCLVERLATWAALAAAVFTCVKSAHAPRSAAAKTKGAGPTVCIAERGHGLVARVMLWSLTMDILTWIMVGLIAGVLASLLVGGSGYGILGDIVVGVVGAFVGGWLFRYAGWHAPWGGLAGVIDLPNRTDAKGRFCWR